jgi:carboxymethylenebutenolidase
METAEMKIEIKTEDGICPAYEYGDRSSPKVLVYMDGIGIRPAMLDVAERIAKHGFFVLLPDLYYRAGAYEPMDAKTLFSDPTMLQTLRTRFMSAATQANIMRDTPVFLDYLGGDKIGTTGYCMGGGLSLAAAGHFPDRIAAAASFHGSRLATDDPTSPHRLAPKIKARVYVAGAIEDASFPDEQKQLLDEALTAAGVRHVVETYPARHGWVPSDTPVHDPVQADRQFTELFKLFDETIRG